MQIVHLIDEASPQGCATTLALLAASRGRLGDVHEQVVLLGSSDFARQANAVGLRDFIHISAPARQPLLALQTVRRRVRDAMRGKTIDLVHCWSVSCLTIATLLYRRIPRAMSLTTLPTPRGTHWLRMIAGEDRSRIAVLPVSSTIRREVLSCGVAEDTVHVLRPGLDLSTSGRVDRATLFKRWGIKPRDLDKARLVALLSDPPHAADARHSGLVASIAEESWMRGSENTGMDVYLIVHPSQLNRARAQRVARGLDRPARVMQDEAIARPWEILPACDAALVIGEHAGGLSLLWAMACNVPIVGEATYAISEIVEDRHSALLCKPDDAQATAHRLRQLLEDRQLAWKLRDTAHSEAFSFFSRQRYCQSLSGIYTQLLTDQPIAIPDLPITGGMRFTGRA